MSSEESPLLGQSSLSTDLAEELEHDKVYDRFAPRQKKVIVFVVSLAGFIPLLVSGSFVPSIPAIARELGSTGPVINLAVSLSLLFGAVGTMFWATYAGYYGRRVVFLASALCLFVGSLGVTLSNTVPSLLLWRVFQAFGAGCGISVGAGVIGDLYKLEERGTAMGIFLGATLLGAAVAPVLGGTVSHYASWRVMQSILSLAGLLCFLLDVLFLPETSHPGTRGIDKADVDELGWRWVWLNPFSCLALLRSPNILAISLAATTMLLTDFVLLIPLSYTIGARYGITNEALIGAMFIAAGVGNTLGAPISGRLSDRTVVEWRRRRGGEWVPEDRLRATLGAAAILVPLSILCSGLITQFIEGRLGIVLNLVCLFMNGLGVDMVLSPIASYNVDILHSRSAEVIAAHKGVRNLIVGALTAGVLPLINMIGVAGTNAIAAGIAWIGFGLLLLTIRYGAKMRQWVDVGYSTIRDN